MDEHIVRLARKGDQGAFLQLIKWYKNDLYSIAFRYFRNEHDALEAVQETTCRAYRSIHKLKDVNKVRPWLIRILTNYSLNEIRKTKKLVHTEWVYEQVDETALDWNDQFIVREYIYRLNKKLQQVILLKFYQGYTIKEISMILDKPEGSIKTWLYKGLNQMRTSMEKEGVFDEK